MLRVCEWSIRRLARTLWTKTCIGTIGVIFVIYGAREERQCGIESGEALVEYGYCELDHME